MPLRMWPLAVFGSRIRVRPRNSQIRLSSSPMQTVTLVPTCVIAPVVWSARGAPSFPFPHPMRERSAESAGNTGHLCEGARVPADRHAHLPALHWRRFSPRDRSSGLERTSLTSPRSRRHWRRPSVRPRPAIEGSPHLAMGTGGGPRRPGRCLRKHSDPGATPCSAK